MISKDDPAHAEQRRLVSARFTPRAVATREAEIREIVVGAIERVRPYGAMEVVNALAARIPATLTCRLLGFPDRCWRLLDDWSARLMRVDLTLRDVSVLSDSPQAMLDLGELAAEVLAERRHAPRDDLMSIWAHASLAGRPMDFETIWFELGLVVPGGVDTTRTTISRALVLLEERPDLFERIARDPACIPGAVEELLRVITPLNNMFRTAVADAELGGRKIRSGDRLCLLYASANRDEDVFARPDEVDFDRAPNPHVAFGIGTHFCLGANLARVTLRVFFEELTRRLGDLRALAPPVYRVPLLWAIHSVHHHQPVEIDVTVGLRTHVLTSLFYLPLLLPLAALGIPLAVFLPLGALRLTLMALTHTRIRTPRWLDPFVNTPELHAVHHSADPRHYDKNIGGILMLWDHLLGTYHPREPVVRCGLPGPEARTAIEANWLPSARRSERR